MKGIIISNNNSNIKKAIVPSGTHLARCYSMIHIGTVEWEYNGEQKFTNKVRLTFELPNEMRDFSGEQKPMVISKEYTLSMHEKSNLRKDLEMWRGKQFTNKELAHFDLMLMLEEGCNLTVIHKTTKAGNEFATIGGLSSLPKGIECPNQFNPTFIFNYGENFNEEWLEDQPEWIQHQIKTTPEYSNKLNQQKFKSTTEDDLPF
jgi:hypothetical protein